MSTDEEVGDLELVPKCRSMPPTGLPSYHGSQRGKVQVAYFFCEEFESLTFREPLNIVDVVLDAEGGEGFALTHRLQGGRMCVERLN